MRNERSKETEGVPIEEPVYIVSPRYSPPESPNATHDGLLNFLVRWRIVRCTDCRHIKWPIALRRRDSNVFMRCIDCQNKALYDMDKRTSRNYDNNGAPV